MHSLEEQERFDERVSMTDDVDELRLTVQGLRDEIRELTTMKEEQKLLPSDYLGDGVYVKDEGHQLAISVNDHRNEPVVFLDPYALKALVRYAERCEELRSQNLPTR